jgi:Uncharacterized anaerobic dehydrogenase
MRARAPRIIFWGMGISQHIHGTDNARCLIALALITGQVGRPGTGLHPLRGQNNVQGASDAGLIPMFLPDTSRSAAPICASRSKNSGTGPRSGRGLTVVEIMNAIHAGEITGMYIEGENPRCPTRSAARARGAGQTRSSGGAGSVRHRNRVPCRRDPAGSAFAEKSGTFTNTDRRVQLAREVIKPPGDAAGSLDHPGNRQAHGAALELRGRRVFTEMTQVMPSLKNITWERLVREGAVTYPVDDPHKPGNEIIFTTGFPTASGRGKIVPAHVIAPDEVPDDEYPMVLRRPRARTLAHRLDDPPLQRARPDRAGGVAFMSPKDMRR